MMSRLGIVGSGEMRTSSRFVVDKGGCGNADRDAWWSTTGGVKKARHSQSDAASTHGAQRRQSWARFANDRHLHNVLGYARGRRLARQIEIARARVRALEETQRRALPGLLKRELDAARRRLSDLLCLQADRRDVRQWPTVRQDEPVEVDDGASDLRNTWCEARHSGRADVRVGLD